MDAMEVSWTTLLRGLRKTAVSAPKRTTPTLRHIKSSGPCDKTCDIVDGSQITGFVDVPKNSDDAMMQALSKQPVSIAIQADQRDFQLYKSGIFTGTCGTKLDHGVLDWLRKRLLFSEKFMVFRGVMVDISSWEKERIQQWRWSVWHVDARKLSRAIKSYFLTFMSPFFDLCL